MEALLVYASGSESDEPGEEQASGAEAEATEDIEANAEERLVLDLGGLEGGVLSFIASCPPYTKLKIPRKLLVAAELEEADSEGEYHLISRGDSGARVGTHDENGKWSIDDSSWRNTWVEPTFTGCADFMFLNEYLVETLRMAFAAAKLVFVYQEQPGVWVFYGAADFVKLAEPSKVCFLSQIQDEEHEYLSLPQSVCDALGVRLAMPDDADLQWDYP